MDLDLSKVHKIFFIGIGGIGISAVARLLLSQGKEVWGSDIHATNITQDLEALGMHFVRGQSPDLIPKDVDLIVYTVAINKYEPMLLQALQDRFNIPIKSYPEMLGVLTEDKFTIAVSGTHGKTTTTAMITKVLIDAGLDPSAIVGSLMAGTKSNLVIGKSNIFVVEACEYERDFLNIKPDILVITNIEAEHLDYYQDLADIEDAFASMVRQTRQLVVANLDTINWEFIGDGFTKEVAHYMNYFNEIPKLAVPGEHNRMNAAAALVACAALDVDKERIKHSLAEFPGTWRRLEKKGETVTGTVVYDDYAHHPTEVRASLAGLRELYPGKKLTVLFQPHLYSRTKALFNEFVTCFDQADSVFLLPIYFAREAPDPSISSEILAEAIRAHGKEVTAFPDFLTAEEAISRLSLGGEDVFVTMGAGEAYKIADKVFKF
jgi:UDP-N-acetylmuramate--alanine ligase